MRSIPSLAVLALVVSAVAACGPSQPVATEVVDRVQDSADPPREPVPTVSPSGSPPAAPRDD